MINKLTNKNKQLNKNKMKFLDLIQIKLNNGLKKLIINLHKKLNKGDKLKDNMTR
jgi:hypothetical protein